MFYPKTIALLKHKLIHVYGGIKPERNKKHMAGHLLWMVIQLESNTEKFPDNRKGSAKAGRWIGWIFREMERMELIDEASHLDELKEDVKNGAY